MITVPGGGLLEDSRARDVLEFEVRTEPDRRRGQTETPDGPGFIEEVLHDKTSGVSGYRRMQRLETPEVYTPRKAARRLGDHHIQQIQFEPGPRPRRPVLRRHASGRFDRARRVHLRALTPQFFSSRLSPHYGPVFVSNARSIHHTTPRIRHRFDPTTSEV